MPFRKSICERHMWSTGKGSTPYSRSRALASSSAKRGVCALATFYSTVACPLNSNKDMSQFESPQSEPTCIYQRTRSAVRLHCFLYTPCLSPRFAIPAHGYLRTAYYVLTTYLLRTVHGPIYLLKARLPPRWKIDINLNRLIRACFTSLLCCLVKDSWKVPRRWQLPSGLNAILARILQYRS
jgi:hypothetical protein